VKIPTATGVPDRAGYLLGTLVEILLEVTFVELEDSPGRAKFTEHSGPCHFVPANLLAPKCRSCLRRSEVARAAVPKTTVNEDSDLGTSVYHIRPTGNVSWMAAVANTQPPERSAKGHLRACVFPSIPRHYPCSAATDGFLPKIGKERTCVLGLRRHLCGRGSGMLNCSGREGLISLPNPGRTWVRTKC